MKVKIQNTFNGEITEAKITPIYRCHHVKDRKYYSSIKDVEFDKTSEYILIENPNSCYGFSALWLKDRKNKINFSSAYYCRDFLPNQIEIRDFKNFNQRSLF